MNEQIKFLSRGAKKASFRANTLQYIKQFDQIIKNIPKEIQLSAKSKPIALQDFTIQFNKKVEYRKDQLLSRYNREIEQINRQYLTLQKRITQQSIDITEEIQRYESRFKRQVFSKNSMIKERLESFKKAKITNTSDFKEKLKNEFQEKLKLEKELLNSKYQEELQTKEQEILHLKNSLEEAKSDVELIEDKIIRINKAHSEQMQILKQTHVDQLNLLEKRKLELTDDVNQIKDNNENYKEISDVEMQMAKENKLKIIKADMEQTFQLKKENFKELIVIANQTLDDLQFKTTSHTKDQYENYLQIEIGSRSKKIQESKTAKENRAKEIIRTKEIELKKLEEEIEAIQSKIKDKEIDKSKIKNDRIKLLTEKHQNEIKELTTELLNIRNQIAELKPKKVQNEDLSIFEKYQKFDTIIELENEKIRGFNDEVKKSSELMMSLHNTLHEFDNQLITIKQQQVDFENDASIEYERKKEELEQKVNETVNLFKAHLVNMKFIDLLSMEINLIKQDNSQFDESFANGIEALKSAEIFQYENYQQTKQRFNKSKKNFNARLKRENEDLNQSINILKERTKEKIALIMTKHEIEIKNKRNKIVHLQKLLSLADDYQSTNINPLSCKDYAFLLNEEQELQEELEMHVIHNLTEEIKKMELIIKNHHQRCEFNERNAAIHHSRPLPPLKDHL